MGHIKRTFIGKEWSTYLILLLTSTVLGHAQLNIPGHYNHQHRNRWKRPTTTPSAAMSAPTAVWNTNEGSSSSGYLPMPWSDGSKVEQSSPSWSDNQSTRIREPSSSWKNRDKTEYKESSFIWNDRPKIYSSSHWESSDRSRPKIPVSSSSTWDSKENSNKFKGHSSSDLSTKSPNWSEGSRLKPSSWTGSHRPNQFTWPDTPSSSNKQNYWVSQREPFTSYDDYNGQRDTEKQKPTNSRPFQRQDSNRSPRPTKNPNKHHHHSRPFRPSSRWVHHGRSAGANPVPVWTHTHTHSVSLGQSHSSTNSRMTQKQVAWRDQAFQDQADYWRRRKNGPKSSRPKKNKFNNHHVRPSSSSTRPSYYQREEEPSKSKGFYPTRPKGRGPRPPYRKNYSNDMKPPPFKSDFFDIPSPVSLDPVLLRESVSSNYIRQNHKDTLPTSFDQQSKFYWNPIYDKESPSKYYDDGDSGPRSTRRPSVLSPSTKYSGQTKFNWNAYSQSKENSGSNHNNNSKNGQKKRKEERVSNENSPFNSQWTTWPHHQIDHTNYDSNKKDSNNNDGGQGQSYSNEQSSSQPISSSSSTGGRRWSDKESSSGGSKNMINYRYKVYDYSENGLQLPTPPPPRDYYSSETSTANYNWDSQKDNSYSQQQSRETYSQQQKWNQKDTMGGGKITLPISDKIRDQTKKEREVMVVKQQQQQEIGWGMKPKPTPIVKINLGSFVHHFNEMCANYLPNMGFPSFCTKKPRGGYPVEGAK